MLRFHKNVHVLILRTYECIELYRKEDSAEVVKVKVLDGHSILDYSRGLNVIKRVLIKERQEGQRQKENGLEEQRMR